MATYNASMIDNNKPDDLVPGAEVINQPKGPAGEYAPLSTNPYVGCGHACSYCYVPLLRGQPDRKTFDAGAIPRRSGAGDYLSRLRRDGRRFQARKSRGQVMLSFTTDIYNPIDRSLTRPALEILIEHGLAICPLT